MSTVTRIVYMVEMHNYIVQDTISYRMQYQYYSHKANLDQPHLQCNLDLLIQSAADQHSLQMFTYSSFKTKDEEHTFFQLKYTGACMTVFHVAT